MTNDIKIILGGAFIALFVWMSATLAFAVPNDYDFQKLLDRAEGKMSPEKETIVAVLLDESGSMSSCKEKTISGLNEYVSALKGESVKVTLTKFNSNRTSVETTALKEFVPLNNDSYRPDASTPLYDAIGRTIRDVEKRACRHTQILFVILTDGLENASREYTRYQIKNLIHDKQAVGWTFTYLGANQDAFAAAADVGIPQTQAVNYDTRNIAPVFRAMGTATNVSISAGNSVIMSSANLNNLILDEISKDTEERK